jgi:hypothetical protein
MTSILARPIRLSIFPIPPRRIVLNVTTHGLSASGEIELIKQPNPFILDGDPPWLSVDLRVFSITESESKFGFSCPNASSAPQYIQAVIAALTTAKGRPYGGKIHRPLTRPG